MSDAPKIIYVQLEYDLDENRVFVRAAATSPVNFPKLKPRNTVNQIQTLDGVDHKRHVGFCFGEQAT